MSYFEDLDIGQSTTLGTHEFTAEDIIRFATQFDPQPFHMDADAAKDSLLGNLCASGWHTASVWMKLMVAHMRENAITRQKEGNPVIPFGPSPGFRELKWIKPVFAGDQITYHSTITAKRESRSKPEWGIIDHQNEGFNQHGERVFSFIGSVFAHRRP